MIDHNGQEVYESLNRLKEKNPEPRPCEICNKRDLQTFVLSSGLGPMSNNICDNIQLKDGNSFETRSEFVKYFETKKEHNGN